jgi:hypothetical protein
MHDIGFFLAKKVTFLHNVQILPDMFFFDIFCRANTLRQEQGCQIFVGPSIPNWEKYNK